MKVVVNLLCVNQDMKQQFQFCSFRLTQFLGRKCWLFFVFLENQAKSCRKEIGSQTPIGKDIIFPVDLSRVYTLSSPNTNQVGNCDFILFIYFWSNQETKQNEFWRSCSVASPAPNSCFSHPPAALVSSWQIILMFSTSFGTCFFLFIFFMQN